MVDTFFNILKKLLVGAVMMVFAFVVIYVPQPFNQIEEAEAFPVTEIGAALVALTTIAASEATLISKEFTLDMIANALAKSFVSAITASIVQWINSGFQGSPAFISDLDGFLLDVADEAAGEFISGISEIGSFICSPFKLDIQIALSLQYQTAREGQPYRGCRLSDMVGNIEDFLAGEFSQGGWEDWFTIVAEPQLYTPYGQLLEAQAGLRASIRNAEGKELQVTSWGDGFLSGKLCEVIEGSSTNKERCVISKPGTVIANSLNKALGAGQDALISADEVNEIVSALLGQIAAQALTGTAGLLGLSSSGGGGGGSYLDQLNQDSLTQVNSTTANSLSTMTAAASVQSRYNQLALQYIPQLQAYIANNRNSIERRNQATDALAEATQVRDKTASDLVRINDLIADYQALEAQLSQPGITLDSQRQIKQQQTQVLQAFFQIGAYPEARIQGSEQTWRSALRPE